MFKRYILQSSVTRVVATPCCSIELVMFLFAAIRYSLGLDRKSHRRYPAMF